MGNQETAEGDPCHEDGYQKTNLLIDISIKSLEGKDNSQAEYHPCQPCRKDGISDSVFRITRYFYKNNGKEEGDENNFSKS